MADTPQPASPKKTPFGINAAGKKTSCSSNMVHRSSKQDTYWFAHAGCEASSEDAARLSPDKLHVDSEASDAGHHHHHHCQMPVSREERLRMVKERQEEDRVRRLQEYQQHSRAAQQFREQQEEERRRRIEEMRQRDQERRHQVEERKRLIWEADHERKEVALRRSMDRDTRAEPRRNANCMSSSFAFGSSTPRTFDLDLAALGGSGAPVLMTASRRSEERDFEANRKRAASSYNLCRPTEAPCKTDGRGTTPDTAFVSPTSAGWLVGSGVTVGEDPMVQSMIVTSSNMRARRKTDLMPVIPWNRGSVGSQSPRMTSSAPGSAKRAVSLSRLDTLAQPRRRLQPTDTSTTTTKSMLNLITQPKKGTSKSMLHLSPRLSQARSMSQLAILPRQTRASVLRVSRVSLGPTQGQKKIQTSSRPRSSLSMASEQSSQASAVSLRPRVPSRKPRPLSIAGTVPDRPLNSARLAVGAEKPGNVSPEKGTCTRSTTGFAPEVPPKPHHLRKPQKPQPPSSSPSRREQKSPAKTSRSQPNLASRYQGAESDKATPCAVKDSNQKNGAGPSNPAPSEAPSETLWKSVEEPEEVPQKMPEEEVPSAVGDTVTEESVSSGGNVTVVMPVEGAVTAESVLDKHGTAARDTALSEEGTVPVKVPRVISEEEARALLAEKRRLAREQAEREAELEHLRQEELRRQEEERRQQQEEEQRRLEEEQLHLVEEFRKQEQEKLQRAIEEQQKREAEEQERKEMEAQQKAEREEQERKAREEAEKQRKELEERLRREEAERAERKKRVEEIMSRTRRRGGAQDSPSQTQKTMSPELDGAAAGASVNKKHTSTPEAQASVDSIRRERMEDAIGDLKMEESSKVQAPVQLQGNAGVNGSEQIVADSVEAMSEEVRRTNGYGDSILNGVGSEKLGHLRELTVTESTSSGAANEHLVDNLLNTEDINLNRISSSSLITFEEDNKNAKAKETQLTDLLS